MQPARRSGLPGLRVLVVDDHATNRTILEESLRGWGMLPATAADPHDALDHLRRAAAGPTPFRLALLDHNLGPTTGVELAREITADPDLADVRLVLLTSSGSTGDPVAIREAGFRAQLTKPVRQSTLYDRLSEVMGTDDPGLRTSRPARPGAPPNTVPGAAAATGAVLVVEDNPVNQRVASAMLEGLGYRVDVAADGSGALARLRRRTYDAILMDCQMLVMDGFETTMAIRRSETATRTPILAMTASAMKGDEQKCLDAGMDGYLTKPVTSAKLAEVLARVVGPAAGTRGRTGPGRGGPEGDGGDVLDGALVDELRRLFVQTQPGVAAQLVEDFIASAYERAGGLADAAARHDTAALASLAHSLRGSSANFGARLVARCCGRIEAAVTDRDGPADVRAVLDELGDEIDRAAAALRSAVATDDLAR